MKLWSSLFFTLVLLGASLPALAGVRAYLDQDHVASGDSVQLMLEKDGQGGGDPELAPLRKDFDVLGTSTSSSIRIVNGSLSSRRQVIVTLSPKRSGSLTVPPLQWDGERTAPLSLSVGAGGGSAQAAQGSTAGQAAQAAPGRVFIESSVQPMQPYVQGATLLDVKVYTLDSLYQASLDLPEVPGVLLQPQGKDRQHDEMRGGQSYRVIERRYLLFPQKSGLLRLDGPVLDAQVPDAGRDPFGAGAMIGQILGGMAGMGSMRAIRVHGDPIMLDVRPRPAAAGQGDWLPASSLSLSENWKPAAGEIHVGDPITRTLELRSTGLTGAQLPDLGTRLAVPAGARAYPDQAQVETSVQDDRVLGVRRQSIAFIADHAGTLTLPAVHLRWWDTAAGQVREAELPARSVTVLPASGAAVPPPAVSPVPAGSAATAPAAALPGGTREAPEPSATVADGAAPTALPARLRAAGPWPWVALAFALIWGLTLVAWWRGRRRRAGPAAAAPSAGPASVAGEQRGVPDLGAVRRACEADDAPAARQALLAWYAAAHPEARPPALGRIARNGGDAHLAGLLRELERACYGGGRWQGQPLAASLDALSRTASAHQPSGAGDGLPPLYP